MTTSDGVRIRGYLMCQGMSLKVKEGEVPSTADAAASDSNGGPAESQGSGEKGKERVGGRDGTVHEHDESVRLRQFWDFELAY